MGLFVFCNMILLELWVMSLKNGNGGLSGGAGRRRGTPKKKPTLNELEHVASTNFTASNWRRRRQTTLPPPPPPPPPIDRRDGAGPSAQQKKKIARREVLNLKWSGGEKKNGTSCNSAKLGKKKTR